MHEPKSRHKPVAAHDQFHAPDSTAKLPMEGEMGGSRKADVFVKSNTLTDTLRKRRIATERGDLEN